METIFEKYYENLDDARAAAAAKRAELKKQYKCYFDCSVWDAWKDNHFENGRWYRWIVIACIWPDTNLD